MEDQNKYIGNELELFANAKNWKSYWSELVAPYLGTNIMEVGAGLGGSTQLLMPKVNNLDRWTALEPDEALSSQIPKNLEKSGLGVEKLTITEKYLKDYQPSKQYDSLLYIDVIEHIEQDKDEVHLAVDRLINGGHLIILVPAHNFLFSPFDRAIGHYRRYNKKMLLEVLPENLEVVHLKYLDSLGLFLSAGNRLIAKQKYPTLKQILFWDKAVVPVSKILDKMLFHQFGKSLLLIGKKKYDKSSN